MRCICVAIVSSVLLLPAADAQPVGVKTQAIPPPLPAPDSNDPKKETTLDNATSEEGLLRAARLKTTPDAVLQLLRARATPPSPAELTRLIQGLGDASQAQRDTSFGALIAVGMPAIPLLRQAANDTDQLDRSALARECLQMIQGEQSEELLAAAVRLLSQSGSGESVQALLTYVPLADNDKILNEIQNALTTLALDKGKLRPELLKALTDDLAVRRAIAVEVVCRVGDTAALEQVRPLLKDARIAVKIRAALGLAQRWDGEAVPTLIGLMLELPPDLQAKAEEYLNELAGDWAIGMPKGSSPVERRIRRDLWLAWWKSLDGPTLVEEFRRQSLSNDERAEVLKLIETLGKSNPQERDRTTTQLLAFGGRALPLLRRAAEGGTTEIMDAARRCVELLEKEGHSTLPPSAARLIGLKKPAGGIEALIGYIPFSDREEMTEALRETLSGLATKDNVVSPALLATLQDPLEERRLLAIDVLVKQPVAQPQLRKLLEDKNLSVRQKVGLALAGEGDRSAIPTLIDLLAELPSDKSWPIEDYLLRVAGEKRPELPPGNDPANRPKIRDAWAAWWKTNEALAVLPRNDGSKRLLGLYLVVEQYNNQVGFGRVAELDNNGKVRWEISNLQSPLHAQIVGNDRVLIAEYNMSRVIERDFKGGTRWERQIPSPIYCERLPNGRTFLAGRNLLMEIDAEGKMIAQIQRNQDYILAAGRLRDGTYGFVNNNYVFTRIDRSGKELKTFRLPIDAGGGTIYLNILPEGHVLVSHYNASKVYEIDANGRRLWEVKVQWPSVPTRAPNGNLIVASNQLKSILELNRSGRVIREFRNLPFRPYLASKR